MTNAVVWLESGTSKVWAVADSLITVSGGDSARRVTDQAMKIMKLSVGAWGRTRFSIADGPMLSYEVCMVYAGAVTPAVMTHACASIMLRNLRPQSEPDDPVYMPAFHRVAELIRLVSDKYIRDAADAYGSNRLPYCEFVIFAFPPSQDEDLPPMRSSQTGWAEALRHRPKRELGSGRVDCYWIGPDFRSGDFCQVAERIDLLGGQYAVIGVDSDSLRNDIENLRASGSGGLRDEPRVALARRIRDRSHDTVGGSLQFGLMDRGRVDLLGAMQDAQGKPVSDWLGFDFKSEIDQVLGMPVVVPSVP